MNQNPNPPQPKKGPFKDDEFDPDWARNQPSPAPAKPVPPAPAPSAPLKRATPGKGTPALGRTTPPRGTIPGFGLAQHAKPGAPQGKSTPGKGAATMKHGHGRATPAGGTPHLELQLDEHVSEHAPKAPDIVAPVLPEGMVLPHLEVSPEQKEAEAPREKVDFENLPEFVAQRRMLKTIKIGVGIGAVVLLFVVLWLAGLVGRKTVKPITDELKREKNTDELIKEAEDKK